MSDFLFGDDTPHPLDQYRIRNLTKERTHRLKDLSPALKEVGDQLLCMGDYDVHQKISADELMTRLVNLDPAERLTVFERLYPKIGYWMDQAWINMNRLPYQVRYNRQAFRASGMAVYTLRRYQMLESICGRLREFEPDIEWLTVYTPLAYPWGGNDTGLLIAAALDSSGPKKISVFDLIAEVSEGRHKEGRFGQHIINALLVSARKECWEYAGELLLNAQREEGFRQVIFETMDEAHPDAFVYMLNVLLDNNLLRFTSAHHAVGVWFQGALTFESAKQAEANLQNLRNMLMDSTTQAEALDKTDFTSVYLALWSMAFREAEKAVDRAKILITSPEREVRRAAVILLGQLSLNISQIASVPAISDSDEEVAYLAADNIGWGSDDLDKSDAFERLEARFPTVTKERKETFGSSLMTNLGERRLERVIPYLQQLPLHARQQFIVRASKSKQHSAEVRNALLNLAKDPSAAVRECAYDVIAKLKITQTEAIELESALKRKAADLRRGIISLLTAQNDKNAFESASRLAQSGHTLQMEAGVEILKQMQADGRMAEQCSMLAAKLAEGCEEDTDEARLLQRAASSSISAYTLQNALGLMDVDNLTKAHFPSDVKVCLTKSNAGELLKQLDDLVYQNREAEITITNWDDKPEKTPLSEAKWSFPAPSDKLDLDSDLERLPLRETWLQWLNSLSPKCADPDGFHLLRARAALYCKRRWDDSKPAKAELEARNKLFVGGNALKLKHSSIVEKLLEWFIKIRAIETGTVDFLLDAVEATLYAVQDFKIVNDDYDNWRKKSFDWRNNNDIEGWLLLTDFCTRHFSDKFMPEHWARLYRLMRWRETPKTEAKGLFGLKPFRQANSIDVSRSWTDIDILLAAYQTGGATADDIFEHLVGERRNDNDSRSWSFDSLSDLTRLRNNRFHEQYPKVVPLVEQVKSRILEIELQRGDLPTPASAPAMDLRNSGGAEIALKLLKALGANPLVRGYIWSSSYSKSEVFSKLIRCTFPLDTDDNQAFALLADKLGLKDSSLIDFAVYAPQWAGFVEYALGWPMLEEAVWWLHAHTKDNQWQVEGDIKDSWETAVSKLTPLDSEDLIEGAVDVDWYHRIRREIDDKKWKLLVNAAKYACGAAGHKRAILFASALDGTISAKELVNAIESKRHQDSVRALGLIKVNSKDDVLRTYKVIQEFRRGSSEFGSQKQESERLASRIALENLSRTAGYPDPIRLEWAMEREAVSDLIDGSVTVSADDVDVKLSINPLGEPELIVSKAGKALKSIPTALKKNSRISSLSERKREINRQVSRMRKSLENAMCKGDTFSGEELQELMQHPVLRPMLTNLVFAGQDGMCGYPVENGAYLLKHDNRVYKTAGNSLKLAHAYDLYRSGDWTAWQKECFLKERVQPFKQVFRELYLPTPAESEDGTTSKRYAGHQVHPKQTLALLKGRGWVASHEDGVFKTWHAQKMLAVLNFEEYFFAPSEIEGLTLDSLEFFPRGKTRSIEIAEVSPLLFSETMRDVDLIVSVAHQGGFDPEASMSSVEMRAAVVRETVSLLGMQNVWIDGNRVRIRGELGEYTVHLGSAVIHKQTGTQLHVVPVYSQHRGRLFLPFVDDDPKTAEVVSKVLMLSNDRQIKDPLIINQIIG